jgi:trimethylamine:corrinoid methyltransferase-like protein
MIVASEEEIRELAYKIWQQTGREDSKANWIEARHALEWYPYQPYKKTLRERLKEFISRKLS